MAVRLWTPTLIWKDQPCYIIGGGPSLETFNWDSLRGHRVLGCNVACYHDPQLVQWVVFGDAGFLDNHRAALEKYALTGGHVVTNSNRFCKPRLAPVWLKRMKKLSRGLGLDRLGWNGNTGAVAINLALLLGANPIYLLGYDMQMIKGKANYHNAYHTKANAKAYHRFMKGMGFVSRDLGLIFPGRRVINLEDNTSLLNEFPKESLLEHFNLVAVGGTHG